MVDVFIGYALWIVPLLIGVAALKVLLVPRLKGMEGEALVGRVLSKRFSHVLHDIIIPDGRGGLTQLDHVVLTPSGILVVETKNYKGMIFGRERDKQWTQKLGRKSYRFMNPLRQNYLHTKALQRIVPEVPVYGQVFFAGDAKFPKGLPEGVSRIGDFRRALSTWAHGAQPSGNYLAAWEKLRARSRTDKDAKKSHLNAVREKRGRDLKTPVALAMLAVSSLWLLIMWMRS